MRWLNRWIPALFLALPVPALGQTIKPADLAGTWVAYRDGKEWGDSLQGKIAGTFMTLDAAGAYTIETKWKDGADWKTQRRTQAKAGSMNWTLIDDTLRVRNSDTSYHALNRRVELKGQRLLFWNNWDTDARRRDEKCANEIYERFDPAKLPTPPPPPPSTIKPADLVGTWVAQWGNSITWTDSLTLGADQTVKGILRSPARRKPDIRNGTWELKPGDWLGGTGIGGLQGPVTLQNGQLISCYPAVAVYTRVAP